MYEKLQRLQTSLLIKMIQVEDEKMIFWMQMPFIHIMEEAN